MTINIGKKKNISIIYHFKKSNINLSLQKNYFGTFGIFANFFFLIKSDKIY